MAGRFVFAAIVTQGGSLKERISHFIITLLIRLQLLSELVSLRLCCSRVFNMFTYHTGSRRGALRNVFFVSAYLEHTLVRIEIIHCQEKNQLFPFPNYILSFCTIEVLQDHFLHKCCKDLLNVAFDFHKNANQMVCRGKPGVGFWVSHNMPCSTARTSAYLCARGSSRAGVCIISPGCAPLNRKTTAMMSQWKLAVSIYPIIHYSAVERTLTTDTKEDTEVGWRHPLIDDVICIPTQYQCGWSNVRAATP